MKLYQISDEWAHIEDALCESMGEITPELESRIKLLLKAGEDSLEAAACVVQSLSYDGKTCRHECDRLLARAESLERSAQLLKVLMLYVVDKVYGGKAKTALFTIWGQNAAERGSYSVPPDCDLSTLPAEYVRTFVPELRKDVLEQARKDGKELPPQIEVEVVPGTRYLRIK